MATLNLSTGAQLATGLNPVTCRRLVEIGDATLITAGVSGWDVVQLNNPTLDAQFQAATASSPVQLGIDNIMFVGLLYPESANLDTNTNLQTFE